jgi:hypothetical protein
MKKILLVIVAICLNGCAWVAWRGYDDPTKTPSPGDYKLVDGGCFSVGTQNLNNLQEQAILEASSVVCAVLKSDEFQKRVRSQNWLASCDLNVQGKPDVLSGNNVYEMIKLGIPDFSVNPQYPWMAIAQTQKSENNHTKNRIAIKPSRIDAWYSLKEKGNLINTIAHESTHLISYSFRDKAHGSKKCPDSKLVSYGVGNLIEELAEN